mmetsp:Transcript_5116/g.15501  ORF Transcript_5116/g.15501 Transcript_5116/m.15501 type:complete len:199 (-) Transcript_5116:208-804(-)
MVAGVYSDPNHAIASSFGGLRLIAQDGTQVTVVGCDDGSTWWTLLGTIEGSAVTIDFSPKAPQVGTLAATSHSAYLEFADGNKWAKLLATGFETSPEASDGINGVFKDASLASANSFAGLRVVSDHLGGTARDEIVAVGTDDGLAFWALAAGSFGADGIAFPEKGLAPFANGVLSFPDGSTWLKQTATTDPHALPRHT